MKQKKEQLQRLRDYLSRTKGQRHPFRGHWLEGRDGYLKNAWLKLLCTLLQAARDISEEQTLFLQRLAAGIGAEYDVEAYMRQGLEVTPEALEEFLELLLDDTEGDKDQKRYAFVLDALVLLHLGAADENAEELLAQVCEALRFTPKEMERAAQLCADVLRQDMPGVILRSRELMGDCRRFLQEPYLIESHGQPYKETGDVVVVAQTDGSPFDLSRLKAAAAMQIERGLPNDNGYYYNPSIAFQGQSYLYLRGLEITVEQSLFFENISMVEFEDCTFVGSGQGADNNTDNASIWFFNCGQVWITNCTFQNFKGRTIISQQVLDIWVKGCSFVDCIRTYKRGSDDWKELGGVILGDTNRTRLRLLHSEFTNCGGNNARTYYASSVISNCLTTIQNCKFKNCRHLISSVASDPANSRRCLFSHILSESDNELTDSIELGPH